MTALQIAWFFIIGVLLTGYAILDGFDLGAGFWHLFTKGDENRRKIINSIGPVWDGNEVWLLTGAGALFAAFPPVYASVFSGFYPAMMFLLLGLMFRAVSMEFRSKLEGPRWRRFWDGSFAVSSTAIALLLGVALGNILVGVPLDADGYYTGTFFDLLNPYALIIGLTGVAMMAQQAALYLHLKNDGELATATLRWARMAWPVYLALFLVASGFTLATQPQHLSSYNAQPALYAIPALALASIIAIRVFIGREQIGRAFFCSSLSIASLMGLVGAAIFPNLVPALGNVERSLSVYNSSSSQYTLTVMLILALAGMPLVIGYTIWIYKSFRGAVAIDETSY